VYCFEKKGVLADPEDDDSVIPLITHGKYAELKASGVVSKGMIPKLDNAFAALAQSVAEVIICHAGALGTLSSETALSGTRLTIS
jgi:acetylglutamate kinase